MTVEGRPHHNQGGRPSTAFVYQLDGPPSSVTASLMLMGLSTASVSGVHRTGLLPWRHRWVHAKGYRNAPRTVNVCRPIAYRGAALANGVALPRRMAWRFGAGAGFGPSRVGMGHFCVPSCLPYAPGQGTCLEPSTRFPNRRLGTPAGSAGRRTSRRRAVGRRPGRSRRGFRGGPARGPAGRAGAEGE